MSLNRRQFLKNSSIGTAALVGGASMLRKSAFANQYPASATSSVAFIGGSSTYGGQTTTTLAHKQLIKDIVAPFTTNIQAAITAGKKIILKPNCVGTGTNDADGYPLACTSYYALAGLIEVIQSINATYPIYICEAGASLTTTMFNAANYKALTTNYTGVTIVDLNTNLTWPGGATSIFAPITRHLWHTDLKTTDAIYAAPIYLDPNCFIISVCRPKAHNNVVITCTTKNCSMGMPLITIPSNYTSKRTNATVSSSKQAMHDGAPTGTSTGEDQVLEWNIFQNASEYMPIGHPDLAICDAWQGMQGQGPTGGTGVLQYCAIAGTDSLAVDRCVAKLVGLSDTEIVPQPSVPVTPSYSDLRYLMWMNNAGFGNYDLTKINFLSGFTNAGTLATLTSYVQAYTLHTNYTASPYWETSWAGTDTTGPDSVIALDSSAVNMPGGTKYIPAAVRNQTIPILKSQRNLWEQGIVTGNEVKIDFMLPGSFMIDLGIFDMKGREIRSLGHEYMQGGSYYKVWDCRDNGNQRVSNGNYIIRLQFGNRAYSDHIALAR